MEAKICGKTISYGKNRYRTDLKGNWQVEMYGSHGPDDPPVGLSYKWHRIPVDKVPDEVKKLAN